MSGPTAILALIQERLDLFLNDLTALCSVDCGTDDKEGVDAVGGLVETLLVARGFSVERTPGRSTGDILTARLRGRGDARILLLGHLDTVYPRGWAAAHPVSVDSGSDLLRGPGTADMKAGVLAGLYAVEALREGGADTWGEITVVLNADEETGSASSSDLIEREASGCAAALVLEAGRANGDIVTTRKGSAVFDLFVQGRAAHAGVEPEKGRSAVLELAHHIIALHALNGLHPGATVNVGVMEGGTRRNVVPAEAHALIDVRAVDAAGLAALVAEIKRDAERRTVPDTTTRLEPGIARPPLERSAGGDRLAAWYGEAARALGVSVGEAATGGGSDGNTTAALGIATLDGLGPVGGDAHSPHEWVRVSSIVPRVVMLAGLISSIAEARS